MQLRGGGLLVLLASPESLSFPFRLPSESGLARWRLRRRILPAERARPLPVRREIAPNNYAQRAHSYGHAHIDHTSRMRPFALHSSIRRARLGMPAMELLHRRQSCGQLEDSPPCPAFEIFL